MCRVNESSLRRGTSIVKSFSGIHTHVSIEQHSDGSSAARKRGWIMRNGNRGRPGEVPISCVVNDRLVYDYDSRRCGVEHSGPRVYLGANVCRTNTSYDTYVGIRSQNTEAEQNRGAQLCRGGWFDAV